MGDVTELCRNRSSSEISTQVSQAKETPEQEAQRMEEERKEGEEGDAPRLSIAAAHLLV